MNDAPQRWRTREGDWNSVKSRLRFSAADQICIFIASKNRLDPIEARMAITPWWGNYGGINDRFGMFGRSAAKAFFETYDRLPALLDAGCPVHPESLVCAALELSGCAFTRALCADFGALRKTGEFIYMRPTMQEIAEYAAILSR